MEFQNYYNQGLEDLKQFVLDNLNQDLNDTTYIIALSALATCSGRVRFGKAIMEMGDRTYQMNSLTDFEKYKARAKNSAFILGAQNWGQFKLFCLIE